MIGVCLICGATFKSPGHHIPRAHGISLRDYKDRFGLPRSAKLTAEASRAAWREAAAALHADGILPTGADAMRAVSAARPKGAMARALKDMRAAGNPRPPRPVKITRELIELVMQDVRGGMSAAESMRRRGVSRSGVQRAIRRRLPEIQVEWSGLPGRRPAPRS